MMPDAAQSVQEIFGPGPGGRRLRGRPSRLPRWLLRLAASEGIVSDRVELPRDVVADTP